MEKINLNLDNLDRAFPDDFTQEQTAMAKTFFLKKLSLETHKFYSGKIQTLPKAPVLGFNWFNVWYTPGVSKISTTIKDNSDSSFLLSNRGNMVAVISDSTRVLGDGDCTPSGGLGVMEGKVFLMKYLAGIDAVALCIDSKDENGINQPENIIKFVKMLQHSFGAINLEDISQPNCYKVLDTLREECNIPVWHDDAQGTACVTLAGLINALKIANKKIEDVKIVLFGAGASNTTIARLIIADGANPDNIIIFDSKGSLHSERQDIKQDNRFYRKWELCQKTNSLKIKNIEEAIKNADVLISLSTPGPETVKKDWIKLMNQNAIVFACANPVPEIYPYLAKEAGALVVATGRGDFPNQVNNSIGFPGILKGALLVKAKKITDNMAIAAAHSIAKFAEKRSINQDNIVPTMDETDVFAHEAADVAMQAIKDGVARINMTWQDVYNKTIKDIENARAITNLLTNNDYIQKPDIKMLYESIEWAINEIKNK